MDCFEQSYEQFYRAARRHLDPEKAENVVLTSFREAFEDLLRNSERTPLTADSLLRRVRIRILAQLRRTRPPEDQCPANAMAMPLSGQTNEGLAQHD